jgi:hypothetical protein
MNTTSSPEQIQSRWETYVWAAVLLLPATLLWEIARMKCFPIIQGLWSHAGLAVSGQQWLMNMLQFLARGGVLIFVAGLVMLLLLELCLKSWRPYRRFTVYSFVSLLNLALVTGLGAMLILALRASGALLEHAK